MALLIGFALDQQVTVQKAFSGPLAISERVGTLDARNARRRRPRAGVPRETGDPPLPRQMAERVHDLAVHVRDDYDGDAARVWKRRQPTREAAARQHRSAARVRRDEGQVAGSGARQALQSRQGGGPGAATSDARRRRLRRRRCRDYQAAKRAHKAEWSKMKAIEVAAQARARFPAIPQRPTRGASSPPWPRSVATALRN